MDNEPENEITVTVFRLLVLDLLALFQVLNHGLINVLGKKHCKLKYRVIFFLTAIGHFFEMSKVDAERALEIYRTFTKQTDIVVQYLSVARQYEHHTRVEVPKLKHAPVNLGRQLEDYLNDPDFEIHRRQYLAEMEAKKNKSSGSKSTFNKTDLTSKTTSGSAFPSVNGASATSSKPEPTRAPDADLIDFFDSIEQNQTTLGAQPTAAPQIGASPWGNAGFQPQPTGFQNGFVPQQTGFQSTNPFQQQNMGALPQQQIQPAYTTSGFGGFGSQSGFQSSLAPIPQDSVASFQTGMSNLQPAAQTTNPFRASMIMMGQPTGMSQPTPARPSTAVQPQQASTNPFARALTLQSNSSPFQTSQTQPPPLQPMATGTNPFAKGFGIQQPQRPATSAGTLGSLAPQPTGTTNPFRQSQFVNHSTGMGWQHNQQPLGGGLDTLQTIPVFPRPAQQTPWQ